MKAAKISLTIIIAMICFTGILQSQTKYLPKTYLTNASNYAINNFSVNATMYGITSALGVDTLGKSASWIYWFYKPGANDSGYAVTIIVIAGFPIPTGLGTPNIPGTLLKPLGTVFCESNVSIQAAENGGGREFRLAHANTNIIGNITKIPGSADTSKPYWSFIYRDSVANQFQVFTIDGITCSLIPVGISHNNNEIPSIFKLEQNYPNPFNPLTKISFAISERSEVSLIVYNSIGEVAGELVKGSLMPGVYSYQFDAKDLPSGVYFYTLNAVDPLTKHRVTETKKMALIK